MRCPDGMEAFGTKVKDNRQQHDSFIPAKRCQDANVGDTLVDVLNSTS